MTRIYTIDNLSAAAFTLAPPPASTALYFAAPSKVAEVFAAGACEAALLPTASLPKLGILADPLPYGIACTGAVGSVLLLANMPLARLVLYREPVAITTKSATSRELFRLLCRQKWGKEPVLVEDTAAPAARLLIGNEAVSRGALDEFAFRYDLGEWWYRRMRLPFVFAQWVTRRGLSSRSRREIEHWIEHCASTAESATGQERLVRANLPPGWDPPAARRYYARLRPRLTHADVQGQALFLRLLREIAPCGKVA
ncbi:MAG: hypothetical protein HYV26_16980 [Candidatus Hydrogenedentes bacterium]|nr:hypothetical protein [Candidatus Hydrogenedentota bacterium]